MKNHLNKFFIFAVFPILIVLCGLPAAADTIMEADTFPVFESLCPNVSFWIKIYTEYATTQGVIHDKKNLAIIYEVIELKDRYRHGSRKINRARIKKAKKKYKQILARLAQGVAPNGLEEQRVVALFGRTLCETCAVKSVRKIRFARGSSGPAPT
ncbi:MAG: hypothetical protein P8X80_12030 [Desulfobacterales bacterium]